MKYVLIIHKDKDSDYGVTVPDLPGCFSIGSTIDEVIKNTKEAILLHIEGMTDDNEEIPEPNSIENLKIIHNDKNIIWSIVDVDISKISGNA